MKQVNVNVSDNFKKMTLRAILAIALFVLTYILLIGLAVAATLGFGYVGIMLIALKPGFLTFMLGIGLVSIGLLILIFLLKFIFKKHRVESSHLIEISRNEEPALFAMIEEIVNEVKTDFPKKIFLSSDVNAAVFYNSNFWSMFLPVRKNLLIGLGLVNAVSADEFKAILAHEFGHFSQRSMKVGSYVYNVNQVIYNLLNDNDSYQSLAYKWANFSDYLSFFVGIAVKIVQGIQWVLKEVYEIVNLSYMGLSREMEFHADEVAANITGAKPLITSLMRLELANQAYDIVLNFYGERIKEGIKPLRIYPQQQFVIQFMARESKLPFENNLPQISLEHLSRYNKSRLNIKNQWASHPSTEDRITKLEALQLNTVCNDTRPAATLFSNMSSTEAKVTEHLFSTVVYENAPVLGTTEQFIEDFTNEYRQNSFHDIYNCYYDNRNPSKIDLEAVTIEEPTHVEAIAHLFSDTSVDKVYTSIALENDLDALRQIADKSFRIKSFDYDGIKYLSKDCKKLVPRLEKELEELKEEIAGNDLNIYKYFHSLANKQGKDNELRRHYQTFFDMDDAYSKKIEIYLKMLNATNFMQQSTPLDQIELNLSSLRSIEAEFKGEIRWLMNEDLCQKSLAEDCKDNFDKYLSKDWNYFFYSKYNEEALNILFTSIHGYQTVLSKSYFRVKKELLDYQVALVDAERSQAFEQAGASEASVVEKA